MEVNLMEHIEVNVEEPRRDRPARPTYLFSPSDVHGWNRSSLRSAGSRSSRAASARSDEQRAADTDNGVQL